MIRYGTIIKDKKKQIYRTDRSLNLNQRNIHCFNQWTNCSLWNQRKTQCFSRKSSGRWRCHVKRYDGRLFLTDINTHTHARARMSTHVYRRSIIFCKPVYKKILSQFTIINFNSIIWSSIIFCKPVYKKFLNQFTKNNWMLTNVP